MLKHKTGPGQKTYCPKHMVFFMDVEVQDPKQKRNKVPVFIPDHRHTLARNEELRRIRRDPSKK